jgi:hypothetical protein
MVVFNACVGKSARNIGSGFPSKSKETAGRPTVTSAKGAVAVMMISSVLLYLWGSLFLCYLALLVYRGHLNRYEDEQLFLNDDVEIVQKNRHHRAQIRHKLMRLRPIFHSCGAATGLITTMVVGMYVYDAWHNIPKGVL